MSGRPNQNGLAFVFLGAENRSLSTAVSCVAWLHYNCIPLDADAANVEQLKNASSVVCRKSMQGCWVKIKCVRVEVDSAGTQERLKSEMGSASRV